MDNAQEYIVYNRARCFYNIFGPQNIKTIRFFFKYINAYISFVVIVSLYLMWLSISLVTSKNKYIDTLALEKNLDVCFSNAEESLKKYNYNTIKSPIVVLDYDNKTIHPMHRNFPSKLLSNNTNESITIVLLSKNIERVGWYNGKWENRDLAALKVITKVAVIDIQSKSMIFFKEYVIDPPKEFFIRGGEDERMYEKDIIEYGIYKGLTGGSAEKMIYGDILKLCGYNEFLPWPFMWKSYPR